MHHLIKKVTLWGLAGIMAVGLFASPNTARQVDAKGGYDANSSLVANDVKPSINAASVTFIKQGASWKYYANPYRPSNSWINPGFDASSWNQGAAPLGYGNDYQATKVTYGPSASNKYISTYFRKNFKIENPAQVRSLTLTLQHDDGAVVYLNGTMVAHPHMGSTRPSYGTLANACDDNETNTIDISPSLLVSGRNTLAVEVHQCSPSSANMIFSANLVGSTDGTIPTAAPTSQPTAAPTGQPTPPPTVVPTKNPTVAPTKAPTAAPTTAPSGSGGLPAAPNGQQWVLRWSDDFNGSSVDTSKWKINNLARPEDTNKTWYHPNNVTVSNGTLKLQVKKESYNGANYTGGMLESTGNYRRNRYGYYEARIKYHLIGPGFWANFWMCGVDRWPPEIDNEIVTHHSAEVYLANHYRDSAGTHLSDHAYSPVNYNDQWHTYGVLWLPGQPVKFYVDGKLARTSSAPYENPPSIDMYISLRAGAYHSASWGGTPNSTTQYPGIAEYDYVKVYQAQ